jgi:hypothetical protein
VAHSSSKVPNNQAAIMDIKTRELAQVPETMCRMFLTKK